ncbi:BREX-1 system adenine-specific DNA-methyltransferase PglX [Pseudomonas sp. B21-028]|uniref:BREX-1 system adenine-specific DNA-methyltransferase PglX n=1 Tax=Pseudomonas sp. B21-028 TaxID=2895480 RepID=UPI00215F438F|nr:BREX-1 system adenine-specific DNA-methyltransferase PglX [Pseudomonas sp. B21-028]UVL82711.1 BREX-1 system adenine-specific DNA-methyltransferase PglX [Pseudomonas sp. B21-028]
MNRSALKKYAPQARLDFIEAVTLRARRLGLDPTHPVNIEQNGDVLLIGGQPFPAIIGKQRATLDQRIQQQGFSTVVETMAYTWFNRLVAIRFMELKGYLSHGYRVLSHPQGQQPEILDHVQHLELTGLDKVGALRLKTAGNQDEALYREILLAQCHELHRSMPFLFEALDDATELLLPDNLLRTDSPIARLVNGIEEVDWKEVEVIGWLYQFYISDKKDEVIGKVVKSEDIPAATQLFTPDWIVQYLVQNSLGRLWLMANPGSNLKEKMPYYIEPAEQASEVQTQLDALIKLRVDEDGGTLNPESLTVLDPACGSGHILVEAYNLLRAIYEERGYRAREIPRLILQKNLYGLDIDDRAAQLAGFALLMKAREDDRRLFDDEGSPPHLNVMAIQQSAGLPDEEMARVILNAAIQIEGGNAFHSKQLFGDAQLETQHSSGLTVLDLRQLIRLFEHGKTVGSLISVPELLKAKLAKIVDLLACVRNQGDDLSRSYASQMLEQFVWPASLLAAQFDSVVANPPYMGSKGMCSMLKEFAKKDFPDSKADLFAMFIERGGFFCKLGGFSSLITMQSWMFLSTYEVLREKLLANRTVITMAHLGARAFSEISGEVVQTTAFVLQKTHQPSFRPVFFRLVGGGESEKKSTLLAGKSRYESIVQSDFSNIPGSPFAYWASGEVKKSFLEKNLSDVSFSDGKNITGDNSKYQRFFWEVDSELVGMERRWFFISKGGGFQKWVGISDVTVDWSEGARAFYKSSLVGRLIDSSLWGRVGISWGLIASSLPSFRLIGFDTTFSDVGLFFNDESDVLLALGFLNSKASFEFLSLLNPTLNYPMDVILKLPFARMQGCGVVSKNVESLIALTKKCHSYYEVDWGFSRSYLVEVGAQSCMEAYRKWEDQINGCRAQLKALEEENNKIFIDFYGLGEQLTPHVPDSQITIQEVNREKDVGRLISYAIGCMMGRYSLDEPGLIYAKSSGIGLELSRYLKFPADTDGIIPVSDEHWFEDDAAARVREFVQVVWGVDTHVENMEWLSDSLGRKAGESAAEAIRRYLSTSFYKDHLQAYKKRPIYWLFSSGKQKAFECLVYLHRYNEGTLSRMRMEYVVPLQSRMQARIDTLADDINSATGSAQQKALQKRKDKFTKQLEELRRFDETLRPYADQRIALNLDDGVKVNYGKFGNLLAEVKAITGGKED